MDPQSARLAGENVQVIVRCRPMNEKEKLEKQPGVVTCLDSQKQIVVQPKGSKAPTKTFYFDSVFGPSCSQRDLFQTAVASTIEEVLAGYNCTIFAYGTTGTGKTFTMEGPPGSFEALPSNASATDRIKSQRDAGIIARSVQQIFDALEKSASNNSEYSVRVSHMELYNEVLRDLLSPASSEDLKLLEDPRLGVQVHNLAELPVYNPQDIFNILEKSYTERRTAPTSCNHNSSRSHCVFSITIHIKESTPEGEDMIKVGKLNLVDLAGSENINRSGADRDNARKQEAGNINKSLLTLGRVITALTDGQVHIPYRESKLTRLLQDSLGGKTKTTIIATISPSSGNVEETMSTLEYAFRAKNIKNRPELNQKMAKKTVIKEYTSEINQLRAQLDCMRRKDGVYLPTEEYERMLVSNKEMSEKAQLLEEMIKSKEKELEELQDLFNRTSAAFEKTEKKLNETSQQLATTKTELAQTTQELNETKVELVESQIVTFEKEQTEKLSQSQAQVILGLLATSTDDLRAVFEKIDRKNHLERLNDELTTEFRKSMFQSLANAEKETREFAIGVNEAFGTLDFTSKEYSSKHHSEIENYKTLLVGVKAEIEQETKSWTASIDEHHQHLSQNWTNIQSQIEEIKQKEVKGLWRTVEEEMENLMIQKLKSELAKKHSATVAGMTRSLTEMNQESKSKLNTFIEQQKKAVEKMDSKVLYFTSETSAKLVDQNHKLEMFVQEQKQRLNVFKNRMMDSVQEMIQTFCQQEEARTLESVQDIQQSLQSSVSQCDSFQNEVSTKWVSSENEKLEAVQTDVCKSLTSKIDTCIQALNIETQRTESHVSVLASEVLETIGNFKSEQISKMDSKLSSVVSNVSSQLVDSTLLLGETLSTSMASLNTNVEEKMGQIEDLMDAEEVALSIFESAMTAMTAAAKEATDTFETDSSSNIHIQQESLNDFNLKAYETTGLTPAKKNLNWPHHVAESRNSQDIIQDFRNQSYSASSFKDSLNSRLHSIAMQTTGSPYKQHIHSSHVNQYQNSFSINHFKDNISRSSSHDSIQQAMSTSTSSSSLDVLSNIAFNSSNALNSPPSEHGENQGQARPMTPVLEIAIQSLSGESNDSFVVDTQQNLSMSGGISIISSNGSLTNSRELNKSSNAKLTSAQRPPVSTTKATSSATSNAVTAKRTTSASLPSTAKSTGTILSSKLSASTVASAGAKKASTTSTATQKKSPSSMVHSTPLSDASNRA